MSDTCRKTFDCGGNCWMNVAGTFDAWEVCSKHCKGTLEQQQLLDDVVNHNNGKTSADIIKEFNLTGEEADIINKYC